MKKRLQVLLATAVLAAVVAWSAVAFTSDCIGDCVATCTASGGCMATAAEGLFGQCECRCTAAPAELR